MVTKKASRYYRIILILCLCFFVSGVGFIFYMMKESNQKNIAYFEESVENMKTTVNEQIANNMETLDGVALTLGEMKVMDLKHLLPIIRKINDRNAFYRMGIIHSNGKADMVDLDGTIHHKVDFSSSPIFQSGMQGKLTISKTLKDPFSNNYLNYYSVPIISNNQNIGVLLAADKTERLRSVLDNAIFSHSGYSNIIDSNGTYIIRSMKSATVENIGDIGNLSEEQLTSIHQNLKDKTSHFFTYDEDKQTYWCLYTPLSYNDWYLLSIVNENMINADHALIYGTILLTGFALLIFLLLFYLINRTHNRTKQHLERLAFADPVLGISNFVKFSIDVEEQIIQRKDAFQPFAFWYGDIDNFKIYNDTFGYEAGDALLKIMCNCLLANMQTHDFFCRESADHFTGIRFFQEPNQLIEWHEHIMKAVIAKEHCNTHSFPISFAIGFYCVTKPEDVLSVNKMYNRAKMAQQSIKANREIRQAFYSDTIRQNILHVNEIESQMQLALKNGEFKMYIQPKTDTHHNHRIMGGEVLVRWQKSDGTIIPPNDFIPIFERNGFIVLLDRYMFASACKWLHDYFENHTHRIHLAVNVSRLDIFQEDFISYYVSIKEQYELCDDVIELEFTESLAIEDHALLSAKISELRTHGFLCSIDDFGAGYSSLNTLKELPIQVIKLDILFFRKGASIEKARIIVSHIIHLAKQLHIAVVAEGIEEPDQVYFLEKCGCDIIQGYAFAKPMPANDFKKLLLKDPVGYWGKGFLKESD